MTKIALTIDVEPNSPSITRKLGEIYSGLTTVMPRLLDLAEKYDVPFTWFITHDYCGRIDDKFPSLFERMSKNGEIGCHVHFVGEEGKHHTDYSFQRHLIEKATYSLRSKGFDVVSFRGGNLFFDENTLRILEEFDYEVDSSVRPGFFSEPIRRFMIDHRQCVSMKPYFPSRTNHSVPGDSKVLEVPLAVYPLMNINAIVLNVCLSFPLRINHVTENPYKVYMTVQKLDKKYDTPIVLFCHPWDLLFNIENKFDNIERFLKKCKETSTKFYTMNEIKKGLSRNKGDMKTKIFASGHILTSYDLKSMPILGKCFKKCISLFEPRY